MAQLPKNKRKRTTTALSETIQKSEGVDFIFELSYLTLFANCFGSCNNTAMLKDDVLENVKSSKDIPNIDWCTLIWDYIKGSKEKWDERMLENWYYGPHVTFTLVYLHYTEFDEMDVPRKYPAVKYWNYELLEERQEKEMARDAIGMVIVIEEDEENEENENQKLKQAVKEAAEKEAAAKAQAEKEAAVSIENLEDAEKEAAAKELAEKDVAEKTVKEAASKEATTKAKEDKEAAAKEAAAKAQAEKEATEKAAEEAKEAAKKKQRAEAAAIKQKETIKKQKEADERISQQEIEKLPEIEKKENKNLDAQIQVLINIINKDEKSYKLRDVKLVFFPIIAHGHYYVTVFDLEKGHAVILDNSISDGDYDGKYKEIFVFVKEMLVHYLYVTKHPALNKVVKEARPKIPKMKWKTKKNKIDCKLYMMMHMEMFEGEIGLKWKTNIVDEKNRHYDDMINTMRMRYCKKPLGSTAGPQNVMDSVQAEKEGDEEKKEDASKSKEKANGKRKIHENQNDKDAKSKVNEEIDGNEKKKRKVYTMLSGRETFKPLFEAMHGLSIERKKVITQMGFRDLIDFPINEVPTMLAFFVVGCLDIETMNLRLPTGNLQISPQTVKEVLGLPKGSRRLERNEGQREKNDIFEEEWKDQYKDETKLTISAISKQITKTTNTDFIFRLNFLMLVANTFGTCDKSSVAKTTVLEDVLEEDDVTEIDWCRYVYECARSSKNDWATRKRDRTEIVYYGPVTFLMLAYLQYTKFDAMKVPRRLPAFKSWNANLLISRETLELDRIKYFGMVDIIGGLNEEEQTAQKEEIYQMLEDKIESILSEKQLFDETIKDTIFKFGNDQRINEYRERLNEIFMNPNEKFKQRSPIYSSSTESSSIKFATSDDKDDNNGDEKAECGDENREHGNKDASSSKNDIVAETNDVCSRHKDEKLNEGEKIQYEMKPIDDISIYDELLDKTDEELKKEYREMKEKEAKSASKKLEDLTDEEFFEVFKEAE
ncbi:hypothetical protein CTI12_AA587400 [Artemisia annua]|uniref:Ulp1 protease family, C-terminal catalytic domain-containing protein n=1 Tax=Artemisia annua TaxID=35608 RepID=A0A2U1KLE1_ARTAN|nr:hypothetical protein CTI12_AA587400 [Artemisia annua]